MKLLSVLCCLLLQVAFAQSVIQPEEPIFLGEKSIVYTQLSSYGLSESRTDVSTLSGANPALIADYRKLAVGIAYQHELNGKVQTNFTFKRGLPALPQEVTVVYPFRSLVFLAGFYQRVNNRIDVFDLPERTLREPQGTGNVFDAFTGSAVMATTIGSAVRIRQFSGGKGQWKLGLKVSANYFRMREEFGELDSSADGFFPGFHAGVAFEWGKEQRPALSISAFGDCNPKFNYTLDFDRLNTVIRYDSLGNIIDPVIPGRRTVEGEMPDRFGMSLLLQPWERFSMHADVNVLQYSELNNISFTDRLDSGIGAVVWIRENLHISSGIYNSSLTIEVTRAGEPDIDLSSFFLNHGLGITYGRINGSLAVLYNTSDDDFTRERFMLKSGIGIDL